MKLMTLMKVFDCQDMPDDIKKIFFDIMEPRFKALMLGNDCYVDFDIDFEEPESIDESDKLLMIQKWLLENGAELDDTVLINYWW
jgi:hypothetical protein